MKDSDSQIAFHKLSTLTEEDIQAVQERVRLRVLKSFKRSGFEEHDVENMKAWNDGGGFSVNGTACIHENDRKIWPKWLSLATVSILGQAPSAAYYP